LQKILIAVGILFLIAGFFWKWLGKIPLFKLPGDIITDKPNVKIFIPITSMIIISVVISLVIYLIRKFL
jgi:hypothetical protein